MACYVGMKAATTFCTRRMSCRVARQGVMVTAEGNGSGEYDYDLFVIGGGSGGVRMARMSAGHGAKVALCELPFAFVSSDTAGGLGGTCVLRGCVPKKLMLYASDFSAEINDSAGFGWDVTINSLSWDMFMRKKRAELERLNGVYGRLLSNANVEAIQGRGTVTGPHSVEVNGTTYTAKYIVVAVGGTPQKLPIPGGEHAITSDEVLELDAMPKKLLVLGAGYIGVEFAGIFHRFGTKVTVALRGDLLLRGFDNEVREFVTEEYRKAGMEVCTGTTPKELVKNDDGSVSVTLVGPDGQERVETYDHCLMATGRLPKTKGLGLEEVGVKMSKKGGIVVNELSQSSVPSIYALGDVTERMELTPVALMEGMALSRHLFLDDPNAKPDHANIATAVFSYPPIGTVGLTEEEAVEQFGDVDVYTSSFRPMKNTISGSEQRALCKILVHPETDKVLGMHMVDPAAPEIMQGMGVAVKMGVTKKQLDSTVGIHPTSAEELVTMRSVSRKIRNREPVAV